MRRICIITQYWERKGGGISYLVGLISNYDIPEDYEKHFVDVNRGNGTRMDYC